LAQYAPASTLDVDGATPRASLEAAFVQYPTLRSYVMNDQGQLRRHIALFINGELSPNALDRPIEASTEIYIMQALSGG
jgi:hypothetical protein